MQITVTVLQLLNAAPVVRSLASPAQKLFGSASLNVRRLAAKLAPEIQAASAARDTLFTEENSFSNSTGARQIRPECVSSYFASDLFVQEITVDVRPLGPDDISRALISADEIDMLGPFFEDKI